VSQRKYAAEKYPLPQTPRIERDPHGGWYKLETDKHMEIFWRVATIRNLGNEGPEVLMCDEAGLILPGAVFPGKYTPERTALWKDLLEKPFREVPDHCLRPDDCRIGEKCCCLRPKDEKSVYRELAER
jgi:hypothetical protein